MVGGGAAVAASIGCSSDRVEKLIPYLVSPDNTVPGVSTYYATTCRGCAASCGVIAETRDGRTTKLEGNPAHPLNRGALCATGQAELQALYNPDRYRSPMIRKNGKLVAAKWDEALQLFSQKLGQTRSRGANNAVFINQHESGSFPAFLDQWLSDYGMPPHISYDSGVDTAAIAAHTAAYGVAWPRFDFGATTLIISFGGDFLGGDRRFRNSWTGPMRAPSWSVRHDSFMLARAAHSLVSTPTAGSIASQARKSPSRAPFLATCRLRRRHRRVVLTPRACSRSLMNTARQSQDW